MIERWFQTRTKKKGGVIKDFAYTPHTNHSILLCDNDYLNLANNEQVVRHQAKDMINAAGRDSVLSSMFLSNGKDPHFELEREMGEWFGKQCYLAQSGYAANVGLMHAICSPGMNVYVDLFLHMSFNDGLAARNVRVHTNKPNDWVNLEENIQKNGPGLILVESLYSSTGTLAPLLEVVRIKKKYNCVLVVDESHSFGLYGDQGKGLVHLNGLLESVDYVTASLSKAYSTRAGVIFANNAVYVKETSYLFIFSSALMRNDIARIRAMWEVIKAADDRRHRLFESSQLLRCTLSKATSVIKVDSEADITSPIVSVQCKDENDMLVPTSQPTTLRKLRT
ncbi:hypothetical protein ABW20_dc0106726 [Dactylellina cionopaga]|nr:hypothetical protein ABW20_dc0106726 [Dactylellina cionopaga]